MAELQNRAKAGAAEPRGSPIAERRGVEQLQEGPQKPKAALFHKKASGLRGAPCWGGKKLTVWASRERKPYLWAGRQGIALATCSLVTFVLLFGSVFDLGNRWRSGGNTRRSLEAGRESLCVERA